MASIAKRTTDAGKTRYDVRYRDPSGRQRKKTFSRRQDADRFARNVEVEKETGRYVDPAAGRITFGEYAERWTESRPNLRPRTKENYRSIIKNHLLPRYAEVPLAAVTPTLVREWWADLHAKDLSPATNAKIYRTLSAIMRTAVDDELTPRTPCRIRGAGTEVSAERPVAPPEQVWALADAMPERTRVTIVLMGFVGLRLGEVLGLERRHVNVLHGRLKVEQQEVELDNGLLLTTRPKTEAGVRTISLPEPVALELERHLDQFVDSDSSARLFTGPAGGTLRRRRLRDSWLRAKATVEALPPNFTMHDLRHTANTITAAQGASTAELMSRLGHSSPAAALRYQHATRARDEELARSVAQLIAPASELGA